MRAHKQAAQAEQNCRKRNSESEGLGQTRTDSEGVPESTRERVAGHTVLCTFLLSYRTRTDSDRLGGTRPRDRVAGHTVRVTQPTGT